MIRTKKNRTDLGMDAQVAKAECPNSAGNTLESKECVDTPMFSQNKTTLVQAVQGDRHVNVGTRNTLKYLMNVDGE